MDKEMQKLWKDIHKKAWIYLNDAGVCNFTGSPYLFENKSLACDSLDTLSDPYYIVAELRKSADESDVKTSLVLVPHSAVAWIEVQRPFREVQTPGFGKKK